MLTLKVIDPEGNEMVYAATSDVSFTPARNNQSPIKGATVGFRTSDGGYCNIYAGIVYVMNDNGRTVADYRLGSNDQTGAPA